MAQEVQAPADAYRACLVGNAVVAVLIEGYEGGDAGILWDERLVDLIALE